jgi:uncharacterized protein YbjT (DUF2867 family)
LRKFPEVSADIGFVPELSALSDESSKVALEEARAIGVVRQYMTCADFIWPSTASNVSSISMPLTGSQQLIFPGSTHSQISVGNRTPLVLYQQKTDKRKYMNNKMKIVVIGGSGLIGTKLVKTLRERGHEVLPASPSSGVNTITGEGLAQAIEGAQVVVDVANAPSWEDKAVLDFFETSGRNLLSAEAAAGVGHHVALSVVGTERLLASGYFRAKMAQENLIKASKLPYTIVRATQFFEFVGGIAQFATEGATVRLPSVLMQPIVSDDVAGALADVANAEPLNDTVELAGPEPIRMDELVRRFLNANGDSRKVITDDNALYYGVKVNDQSLVPGDNPRLGATRFEDWLNRTSAQRVVPTK